MNQKTLYVVTYFETWEYSGVHGIFPSKEAAQRFIDSQPPSGTCRCGQKAGTEGHERCAKSAGYDIEEAELFEE